MDETHTMAEKTDCGVCGRPLVYGVETVTLICALCGREESSLIRCPAGHFVCDDCHGKPALDVLADVLRQCNSTDPGAILERAMAHPSVTMHGPEHHAIVPAVLVAAVTNAGSPTVRSTGRSRGGVAYQAGGAGRMAPVGRRSEWASPSASSQKRRLSKARSVPCPWRRPPPH
jgi:hypothetical protein